MSTPNKYRNEVEVVLSGTKYLLRPTFKAIAEIEEKTGKSLFQVMAMLLGGAISVQHAFDILKAGIEAAGGTVDDDLLQQHMIECGLNGTISALDKFLTAATNPGDNAKKN